ncbi:hypothetical protein BV582_22650 [Bacillus paralicheniformis]|uniref:PQQ-binding-like beta-propeller repeat protein n=1 Tax=uncultured organism TaxID=155900 RepID=A0A6G7MAJ3_9ZZZZ|nr:hypothetical protein BV582_22650 [Bacillus paralicheniformis]QIJ31404.1 PQQ-binding-like beta-propeller repeat protein [uncultured organism]
MCLVRAFLRLLLLMMFVAATCLGGVASAQQAPQEGAKAERKKRTPPGVQPPGTQDGAGQQAQQAKQPQQPPPKPTQPEEVVFNVFQPAPSDVRRPLMRASKAISEGRHADAAYELGVLLATESLDDAEAQDYFLIESDTEQPLGRTRLKAEAEQILASLPAQGRQAYELQFGAQAQAMLDEALTEGDMDRLAEVVRKFFHTRAGYEASMLAGRFELARGRPMAAALFLQRLAETSHAAPAFEPELSFLLATCWMYANQPAKAKAILVSLKRHVPDGRLQLGNQQVSLFTDEDEALTWLDELLGSRRTLLAPALTEWLLFRGNAQRNGRSQGSMPLINYRWRVPTCIDRADEKIVERLTKQYRDEGRAAPPALQPLSVGDTILMRTPRKLLGVDFNSGKRVWVWPPWEEDRPERIFSSSNRSFQLATGTREHEMHQRIWDDAAHGQISSDGESVFLLHELGYTSVGNFSPNRVFIAPGGVARRYPGAPRPYNELVSLSLARQGAAQWIVGGESGEDEPKLAGAFFLGAPLPLQGKLYALAEFNGEIRLVVLDARSGRLDWQQQLAHVDMHTIERDSGRRLAAATPSYEGGVLLCPTCAGALVAVDISTRSLLWGYQYYKVPKQPAHRGFGFIRFQPRPSMPVGSRWSDSTVTVADGRVLLTVRAVLTASPSEGDELHCLDLLTGERVWEPQKRGDRVFLACIHDGTAVFVGNRQVSALRLDNGQPAWSSSIDLVDPPSGRGVYSLDHYFLPTAGSELLKIDISRGEIVSRCSTAIVLGNLICYRDEIISQGPDFLATFYQTEPLKRRVEQALSDDPDDAEALARFGELLLQEGRRDEAITTLRKAHSSAPGDDMTRTLLVSTLMETLRDDFTAHEAYANEIARLLDRPGQRSEYLRLMASGRQKQGEILRAFDAYLDLSRLKDEMMTSGGAAQLEVERVDQNLVVRMDRWLQARIGELLAAASASEREQMDRTIREELDRALGGGTSELRRFLRHFGAHPWAKQVRMKLAAGLIHSGELLEAEMMLTRLVRSDDDAVRAVAVAEMARLLELEGRYQEAVAYYRQLAGEWGDAIVHDGKTGEQLADEAMASQALKEALDLLEPWPHGKGEVTESADSSNRYPAYRRVYTSRIRQQSGPSTAGMSVSYDQHRKAVVVRDGRGAPMTNVGLGALRLSTQDYSLTYARVNGHVLLVSLGVEIVAIDLLQATRSPTEAILWRRALVPPPPGTTAYQTQAQVLPLKHPWGGERRVYADAQKQLLGVTGPLCDIGAYYTKLRELVCVDPISGDTVWAREDLPQGSDLFGDDEMIFVVPRASTEAFVFSALDGREMGQRELEPLDNRWSTFGRNVLAWEQEDPGSPLVLRLYDAWSGEDIWREELPLNTKATLVDHDEVAVLQPDGRFVLRTLKDDRVRIETTLEAEPALASVHVLRSADQYIVLTNRHVKVEPNTPAAGIRTISSGSATPLVAGYAHAFDRETGEASWPSPVAIERYGFSVDQPSETPVLVFARHVTPKPEENRRQLHTSVLILDRRDGRVLFAKDDIPAQTYNFEVVADRPKQMVSITLPNKTITIKLTDEPIPTETPTEQETDPAA